MENILGFQDFSQLLESYNPVSQDPQWREGGIVFIRGNVLHDGKPRLYAARVKRLWRRDGGFFMVNLYPELFIILRDGWGFSANKIQINKDTLPKSVGISSFNLALNAKSGKTPLWRETINKTHFPSVLKEWERSLESWEEFKF